MQPLWVSGALSAIVENIPYVATMAPVTATLVQDFQGDGDATVLWWSLALGADLGGSATAIGASANVVILGLAQRAGQPISFLAFTRYGPWLRSRPWWSASRTGGCAASFSPDPFRGGRCR